MEVLTPRNLDEALRLRAEQPDALAIQGGTDLMVAVNFDRARPPAILNLNEVAELRGWSRENGAVRLGAGLTYTEAMEPELAELLAGARGGVAHRGLAADPQPRHDRRQSRDRVAGGRRAAAARRRGRRGRVRIGARHAALPIADFVTGVKRNALAADELITAGSSRRRRRRRS